MEQQKQALRAKGDLDARLWAEQEAKRRIEDQKWGLK